MKPTVLTLLFVLNCFFLFAQKNYDEAIMMGDNALDNGDFEKAISLYFESKTFDNTRTLDVKHYINRIFDGISLIKTKAKEDWNNANQNQIADNSPRVAEIALAKADSIQYKAETLLFDNIVREKFKDWKGFNNYTLQEKEKREEKLAKTDSLDLSGFALRRIPFEVTYCPNLKHINLLGNSIDWKESEKSLKKLSKNTTIYVSVEDLSAIDSSYWRLVAGVEVQKDGLSEIPLNILGLKQINYLQLGYFPGISNFNQLPQALFELTQLKYLIFGNCSIDSLPPAIKNLQNLTLLSLTQSTLSSLPAEIGNLQDLAELDLSYNQLNSLPSEIQKLKKLKYLYLTGNNFSKEEIEKIKKWLPNCEIDY